MPRHGRVTKPRVLSKKRRLPLVTISVADNKQHLEDFYKSLIKDGDDTELIKYYSRFLLPKDIPPQLIPKLRTGFNVIATITLGSPNGKSIAVKLVRAR
jgi:hypothetical protein